MFREKIREAVWHLKQPVTSKSATERFKTKEICVLERPDQSPDHNPRKILWHDLKRAVHVKKIPEIQRNVVKFLLISSAATGNVWWRILQLKEIHQLLQVRFTHPPPHPAWIVTTMCSIKSTTIKLFQKIATRQNNTGHLKDLKVPSSLRRLLLLRVSVEKAKKWAELKEKHL